MNQWKATMLKEKCDVISAQKIMEAKHLPEKVGLVVINFEEQLVAVEANLKERNELLKIYTHSKTI